MTELWFQIVRDIAQFFEAHPFVQDWLVIFLAVGSWETIFYGIGVWREKRRERILDIGCDYCAEATTLYRDPSKRFWLCRKCMNAYLRAHPFTREQVDKVKSQYKAPKSRKRKKKTKNTPSK